MIRSKILPATMAAVFVLGAGGAAVASSDEHEGGREIAAVLAAKTSVAEAIAAAEQHAGGRAMKIDIEKDNGAYVYEIKTVSKDKITEVLVDPASGKVVRTDDEGLIARIFDSEDRDELAKLTTSSTTLAAAIATAEQHTGGKAIEARVDDDDTMLFKVEVAKGNTVHKVMVDGATGKVVKVKTSEDDEDDDDDD
jgi:uncharacterized membrane protein YkoI